MSEIQRFEADFDFTWDVLVEFLNQRGIQRALAAIHECGATGWEKWWQIELAVFLSDHEDIGDWNMEEGFLTDRRTSIEKDSIAVDLCFRRKKQSTDSMIMLELKQDPDWKRCINNMFRDAQKVFRSQSRSLKGSAVRSFFVAGIYLSESKSAVHDYIAERADQLEIDWELMDTKFIAGTDYSLTVF